MHTKFTKCFHNELEDLAFKICEAPAGGCQGSMSRAVLMLLMLSVLPDTLLAIMSSVQ